MPRSHEVTKSSASTGSGDCRYHISTVGLEPYLMTTEELAAAVTGGLPDE